MMRSAVSGLMLPVLMLLQGATACAGEYARISDDVEMYYEEVGQGRPVIFVSGWSFSGEVFKHQLDYFSDHYRAITLDSRSQGRSTKTPIGNNYLQHGRDLRAFITSLGLTDVVLVGWSWGCFELYSYVRLYGLEDLSGLVCIDCSPQGAIVDEGDWGPHDYVGYEEVFRRATHEPREWLRDTLIPQFTERELSGEEASWLERMSLETPHYAGIALFADAMFEDFADEVETIDEGIPYMVVLNAGYDNTDKETKWLAIHAPNARSEVFGAHMMFYEYREKFNAVLHSFLREVDAEN